MTRQRVTNAQLVQLVKLIAPESARHGLMRPDDRLVFEPGHASAGIPYRLTITRADGTRDRYAPADGDGGALGMTARDAQRTLATILHTLRAVSYAQRDQENRS